MSFNSKSLPPPTSEQKRRWDLLRSLGCLTCYLRDGMTAGRALEIHHFTLGDRHGAPRLGHDFTICLCDWCHRGIHWGQGIVQMEYDFGPSFALTPRAFRNEYGGSEYLLKTQNELIGWTKPPVRERLRRNGSPTAKPRRTLATKGNTKQDGLTREQIGKWLDKRGRKYAPPIKRVKRPEGFRI